MPQNQGRVFHAQLVHYLRKTVNFNDAGVASGARIGTLPAGAQILDAVTRVETAFNAATTNVLTAGTNASTYDNIVGAGDVTEGTPAAYRAAIATAGAQTLSADTDVFVRYTQTGTAATTGRATITIAYSVNNDG